MIEEIYHFYPEMARIKRELSRGNSAYYDNLSLAEFLHKMPLSDWMLKILEAGFVGENGAEAAEQSAAIMLATLDFDKRHFRMYGDSDERFKIRGGNSRIIAALTEQAGAEILFEHKLLEIREKSGGEITLTFDQSGTTRQYTFDYVIVTIPFTLLRETDLRFEVSPEKNRVIREMGYGANTKFVTETLGSPWRQAGYRGYLYSDAIPNGWDSSQLQTAASRQSTYTCYLGGRQALDAAPRTGDQTCQRAGWHPEQCLPRLPGGCHRRDRTGILARAPARKRQLLLLQAGAIHQLQQHCGRKRQEHLFCRRAHQSGLGRIHERGC
jgi:monoamine oxidase